MFFFVLPLIFGRDKFLCSDSNLIVALENPSRYCQAQGEYIRVCMTGFGEHAQAEVIMLKLLNFFSLFYVFGISLNLSVLCLNF